MRGLYCCIAHWLVRANVTTHVIVIALENHFCTPTSEDGFAHKRTRGTLAAVQAELATRSFCVLRVELSPIMSTMTGTVRALIRSQPRGTGGFFRRTVQLPNSDRECRVPSCLLAQFTSPLLPKIPFLLMCRLSVHRKCGRIATNVMVREFDRHHSTSPVPSTPHCPTSGIVNTDWALQMWA